MKSLHVTTMFFKGGGAAAPSPIAQAPVPTPAPPVTMGAAEVVQAGQDLRRHQMMKKTAKSLTFAGDTGGFGGPMVGSPYGKQPSGTGGMMGVGASPKV